MRGVKRKGHPSLNASKNAKGRLRDQELNANNAISAISKSVVKERTEMLMVDSRSALYGMSLRKVNEMSGAEELKTFAFITSCVPDLVKERILLHFNDETAVVDGERVFLVLSSVCQVFRHSCFANLLENENWKLPLTRYKDESFTINFSKCGSEKIKPDVRRITELHLGNKHRHWMCSQGENCRKFADGHAFKGYNLGGIAYSDYWKLVDGEQIFFASCAECASFQAEGAFQFVQGKKSSLRGIKELKEEVVAAEKETDENTKEKISAFIAAREKRVQEKLTLQRQLAESRTCIFLKDEWNFHGSAFKCTGTHNYNYIKFDTLKRKMFDARSKLEFISSATLDENEDLWCCTNCDSRLVELKKKECTFRKNDHVDDNGVTFKCKSKIESVKNFTKLALTKGKMPKGSEFCGVVAKALAANGDALCCLHCRNRLFTRPPPPAGDFFKPRSSKKQKISK